MTQARVRLIGSPRMAVAALSTQPGRVALPLVNGKDRRRSYQKGPVTLRGQLVPETTTDQRLLYS